MTTLTQNIFLGPEYWVLHYETDMDCPRKEEGFLTMNSALRRLRSLQIEHYPSTIQRVELHQIFEDDCIDGYPYDEIQYLDEQFLRAMEDPRK